MYEYEGTRGGVGTAEAARCGNGGKGTSGFCERFRSVNDKVGEDDDRDARESSPHAGRRLKGGKVTCRKKTGRKETGHRETGRKETGRKEMGGQTSGSKERGVGQTVAKETEWRRELRRWG